MRGLVADINVQGHVDGLIRALESAEWQNLWELMRVPVWAFSDVGLAPTAPDVEVWKLCQERQLILITSNRNEDDETSLEATLRAQNTPTSLPVFTLADAERVRRSRSYAIIVAGSLLEHLIDIDNYLGAGRVYLP